MKTSRALTAVAGAGIVASIAYGVGTQVGGGSADAARSGSASARSAAQQPGGPWRGGPGDRSAELGALATRLGVSTTQLQSALQAVTSQQAANETARQSQLASALAGALGVPADQVTAALAKLRGPHPGGPGGKPGDEAGEKAGNEAGETAGNEAGETPGDEAGETAGGKDPGGPENDRAGGRDAGFATALAKALGLDAAKVQAALGQVRGQQAAGEQARRDAFAQALADQLNLPVAKVKAAVGSGDGGHPAEESG